MRVLQAAAPTIAQTCAAASADEMIIAVITRDMTFHGAWAIAPADLSMVLEAIADDIWSPSFPPQAPVAHIHHQCEQVADMAAQRGAAIQR